jgi:hypothetical protein
MIMTGKATQKLLLVAGLSLAWATASAAPGDGITGTKHDFTSSTAGIGMCTFCHTPHKAASTLLLWNHTLSSANFAWDVTATTAGTVLPTLPGLTYAGPSTKCLSCHDGSVAIGDVGWFNGGKPGQPLSNVKITDSTYQIGPSGAMKGNHPVGVPYPYQNAANAYNGTTGGGALVLNEWVANPMSSSNVKLYNDAGGGSISGGPVAGKSGIECTSCHDPHNKAAVDVFFLRGKLTGTNQASGYICTQCHVK